MRALRFLVVSILAAGAGACVCGPLDNSHDVFTPWEQRMLPPGPPEDVCVGPLEAWEVYRQAQQRSR